MSIIHCLTGCNNYYSEINGIVQTPVVPIWYEGQAIECSWTIDGGTTNHIHWLNWSHFLL